MSRFAPGDRVEWVSRSGIRREGEIVEALPGKQWAVRPDGCAVEQAVDADDLSRIPEPADALELGGPVSAVLTVRQRESRARKAALATPPAQRRERARRAGKASAAKRERERQPPAAAPQHAGDFGRAGGLASAQRRRERAATVDQPPAGKNPAAVALGKLGGKKGAEGRMAKLSPEERSRIAARAARVRWAKTKSATPVADVQHGTRHAYMNRGCRCAPCRQANTDYNRERYQQQRRGLPATNDRRKVTLRGGGSLVVEVRGLTAADDDIRLVNAIAAAIELYDAAAGEGDEASEQ